MTEMFMEFHTEESAILLECHENEYFMNIKSYKLISNITLQGTIPVLQIMQDQLHG
jgi:hypothetical protein